MVRFRSCDGSQENWREFMLSVATTDYLKHRRPGQLDLFAGSPTAIPSVSEWASDAERQRSLANFRLAQRTIIGWASLEAAEVGIQPSLFDDESYDKAP